MNSASQKANEDVLTGRPSHFRVDGHFEGVVRLGNETGFVLEAVLDVCFTLRVEETHCVDHCGCNEVVPRGHAEVAVEEEEDDEDEGHEKVGGFEKFIVSVPGREKVG